MPARRPLFALALAALLAAPAARAQAPARAGGMTGGVLLGIESANGDSGIALRLDGAWRQRPLTPQIGLSIVGSVGYTRVTEETSIFFASERLEGTLNLFRFVPAARFTFGNHPTLVPYGDLGMGLYVADAHLEVVEIGTGAVLAEEDETEIGLSLRLAAGLMIRLGDGLTLGGELGLNPASGDLDTTVTALAALTFRL